MNSTPQILDPCCGGKMLWFNKNDRRAAFCDRRREKHILCDGRFFEVNPDTVCDFRKLPFPDESFFLICFDPPHLLQAGETSWIKTGEAINLAEAGNLAQEHERLVSRRVTRK